MTKLFVFDDGGRGADGPCIERAIAIGTQTPHAEVTDGIAPLRARCPNKKIPVIHMHNHIHGLGWRWTESKPPYVPLSDCELPNGRLIVRAGASFFDPDGGGPSHLVAVVDNVIHDTWDSSALRVVGYFSKRESKK